MQINSIGGYCDLRTGLSNQHKTSTPVSFGWHKINTYIIDCSSDTPEDCLEIKQQADRDLAPIQNICNQINVKDGKSLYMEGQKLIKKGKKTGWKEIIEADKNGNTQKITFDKFDPKTKKPTRVIKINDSSEAPNYQSWTFGKYRSKYTEVKGSIKTIREIEKKTHPILTTFSIVNYDERTCTNIYFSKPDSYNAEKYEINSSGKRTRKLFSAKIKPEYLAAWGFLSQYTKFNSDGTKNRYVRVHGKWYKPSQLKQVNKK